MREVKLPGGWLVIVVLVVIVVVVVVIPVIFFPTASLFGEQTLQNVRFFSECPHLSLGYLATTTNRTAFVALDSPRPAA